MELIAEITCSQSCLNLCDLVPSVYNPVLHSLRFMSNANLAEQDVPATHTQNLFLGIQYLLLLGIFSTILTF